MSVNPQQGIPPEVFATQSELMDQLLEEDGVVRVPLKANGRQLGWAWIRPRPTPLVWDGETFPYEVVHTELFDAPKDDEDLYDETDTTVEEFDAMWGDSEPVETIVAVQPVCRQRPKHD